MSGARKRVVVVGSTGSIGTQALEVVRAEPERFEITALGAATSVAALAEQADEFRPAVVAMADAGAARELEDLLPPGTELYAGEGALEALAGDGRRRTERGGGLRRHGSDGGRSPSRQPSRPGQQGVPRGRGPGGAAGTHDRGCRAHPGRLGALRHPSMSRRACRRHGRRRGRGQAGGDGERRAVPRQAPRPAGLGDGR